MVFLYNLALFAAVILSSPWWLLRMARAGKYRTGLRERLGRVPARIRAGEKHGGIWIHAVSVGEVLAVAKLVEELRREYPRLSLVISTTTAAGQKLARERYGEENVFYFPLDFGFAVRPYLRALQPRLVILAEFPAAGEAQRRARCRGECAHLRPFVSQLPAMEVLAAACAGQC